MICNPLNVGSCLFDLVAFLKMFLREVVGTDFFGGSASIF